MLELLKDHIIEFVQTAPFGPIHLKAASPQSESVTFARKRLTMNMTPEQMQKIIEAALMVSGHPLTVANLQKLFDEQRTNLMH